MSREIKKLRKRICQRCWKPYYTYAKRGKICPKCNKRKRNHVTILNQFGGLINETLF
ncbi:hypothetical protein HYW76_02485 [Candidatus Pacearchaeota archaeon]|nr:hypothetical protein [Candidatus Pacearchaeota archaeon]